MFRQRCSFYHGKIQLTDIERGDGRDSLREERDCKKEKETDRERERERQGQSDGQPGRQRDSQKSHGGSQTHTLTDRQKFNKVRNKEMLIIRRNKQ